MVRTLKELRVVIDHFDKYPLLTQKRADFELFKLIVEIMSRKDITQEDLQEIINIRASMNKGLSDRLKDSFPNTEPVSKPKVQFSEIPDSH